MSSAVQPCAHTAYADDIDWTPGMDGFLFMLDTKYSVSNTDVARLFSQYFPGIAETCIAPVCPSFEVYLQTHLTSIRGNRTNDALRRHLEIQAGFDSHKLKQAPTWWTTIQNQIVFAAQRLGIQVTATAGHQPSRLAALLARNPVPPIGTGATTHAPATTATNVTIDGISIANPAQAPAPVPPQAISMAVSRHGPNAVHYQLQSPAPTASMRDAQRVVAEKERTAAQRAAAKAAEAAAQEARMQPAGGIVRSRRAPAAAGSPSRKTYAGAPGAQTPPDASSRETRAQRQSKRELSGAPAPAFEDRQPNLPSSTPESISSNIPNQSLHANEDMDSQEAFKTAVATIRNSAWYPGPVTTLPTEVGDRLISLWIDPSYGACYISADGMQVSEFIQIAERSEEHSVYLVTFVNQTLAEMPVSAKMERLVPGRTGLLQPSPLSDVGEKDDDEEPINTDRMMKFVHHEDSGTEIQWRDGTVLKTPAAYPAAALPNPMKHAVQRFGPLLTKEQTKPLDAIKHPKQPVGGGMWQAVLVPPEMRRRDWDGKKAAVKRASAFKDDEKQGGEEVGK